MISTGLSLLFRGCVLILATLILVPSQTVACITGPRYVSQRLPMLLHRCVLAFLGVKVTVYGTPAQGTHTLYLSNHCSYLDIPILGGLVTGSFVAKSEVAHWPVLGWLCRLQNTIFINRTAVLQVKKQRERILGHLGAGHNLILFPEGTSSDGNRVLPFKSSLLPAEETKGSDSIVIQPISIAYSRLDGMPMGRAFRPAFAWYGTMALAPHVGRMLLQGYLSVDVIFHPTCKIADFSSRKDMATHCRAIVTHGVVHALCGRVPKPHACESSGLKSVPHLA